MSTLINSTVDAEELRLQVREMYSRVALDPHGSFHFEMGRELAIRLGYPVAELDLIPAEALESFAGVGYFSDLAELRPAEVVLDLGSGSGTDCFLAARQVGPAGRVVGIDMTAAQRTKAEALRIAHGFANLQFRDGLLEALPVADASVDVVISNGVINLAPDKERVFAEIQRVLRPGGRLAIADIVTDAQLPETITCNASLWSACIGGAAQRDSYGETILGAGFADLHIRENPGYGFLSRSARNASEKYGVKSVSVRARKAGA